MLFDEQLSIFTAINLYTRNSKFNLENSCGSGTASIGVFNNYKRNDACNLFYSTSKGQYFNDIKAMSSIGISNFN